MMNIFHAQWRTVTPVTVPSYPGTPLGPSKVINDIQEGEAFITAGSESAVEYAVKQLHPTAEVTVKFLGNA